MLLLNTNHIRVAIANEEESNSAPDKMEVTAESAEASPHKVPDIPRVPDLIAGKNSIDDWRQSMQRMREEMETKRKSQRAEMDQRREQMRKKREAMRERADRMREDSSAFRSGAGNVQLDEEGNPVSSGGDAADELMKKHEERMKKMREAASAFSTEGKDSAPFHPESHGMSSSNLHQRQVESKVNALRERIERDKTKFNDAALSEIEAEIVAYEELESRIGAHSQSGVEDFEKVNEIEDADARKEYMQKLRDERKARREEETHLRKEAREKYNGIQKMLDSRMNSEL